MSQLTKVKSSTHTHNLCTSPFLATRVAAMKSQSQQQAQSSMCTHSCCFLNACLTPVLPLSCSPLRSRQINDSAGEACRCIVLYAGHVIVDRLSSIWRPGWHPHDSVSDLTCLLCFYEHKPCKLHGCTHSALKSLQPPSADPPSTCQASLKRH